MRHTGLRRRPIIVPAVGNFRQGMLVQLPLHLDTCRASPSATGPAARTGEHYTGSEWVTVEPPTADGKLDAPRCATPTSWSCGSTPMTARTDFRQAVVVARLDNLGKGASGAAVQNLRLMLGL
jgi:N-acetyl-gamma-glutamyl-phosphate reductase